MVAAPRSTPSHSKVAAHRQRLRERGMRPIQIWVPDVHAAEFRAEAHRQSAASAASVRAQEDQAFIDAVTDWGVE